LRTERKTEGAIAVDYVKRVNRAIDHIVRNLAGPLSLDEVSEAAGFSPFHFHRVFKSLLGETLNQFVKRLRLERALYRPTGVRGVDRPPVRPRQRAFHDRLSASGKARMERPAVTTGHFRPIAVNR